VPAYRRVLCHHDLHPGNVLWHHGRVTGVVDVVGIERPETWRGHDAGRTDMTIDALVRSLDDFLAAALDRLS
jgi:Phosphotransferase enzyme family